MNKKEYDKLIELKSGQIPVVQIFNLNNKADRTLLYGYTCDKDTFHVYIKNMKIHIITYTTDFRNNKPDFIKEILIKSNNDYILNKRLYPETCDYEFCEILKQIGYNLPFTLWNYDRPISQFYGFTLEDRKCCENCGVIEASYCNKCVEYNKWFCKKEE